MSKTVIHIGANKTASTTFQRALYRNHSGLHYVGEDAKGYESYFDLLTSMVSDDELHFSADQCGTLFSQHVNMEPEKTFIYSNEDLMTSRIPVLCAQRLKEYMPNAEILLVVRNQLTAIPSFYANHGAFLKPAPSSYFKRHVSFDDWIEFQATFSKYGAFASYFYSRLLSVYADLYGSEHVHVLVFEEFLQDKNAFIKKLCNILEIDFDEAIKLLEGRHERPRITNRMLNYNAFRTDFFWDFPFAKYMPGGKRISTLLHRFLEAGPSAKIELSNKYKQKLHELYAEDNTKLIEKYGVPIENFGYPVL